MKRLLLLCTIPILSIAQNNPPTNYTVKSIIVEDTDHVFLNLNSNTTSVKTQTGWDIALYNEVHEIGGKINETRGVKVWRVYKDTTQFSAITFTDTLNSVVNSSSIFYYGALDTFYRGSFNTSFNIGIGTFYTDPSFVNVATKIYIIKREDNVYGKFYISYKSSPGREFTIRYADLDNSNPRTIVVSKVSPIVRHYRYINLSTGAVTNDFEPLYNDWDLLFRKYNVGLETFPIGVLTNNAHNLIRMSSIAGYPEEYLKPGVVKTEAYEAIGDPATVLYNNSLNSPDPISREFNQIGEKWLNKTSGQPVSGRSYFLKDRNNKLWHIVFTTYDAASKSINIAFINKGSISSISSGYPEENEIKVYQDGSDLKMVSKTQGVQKKIVTLFDITGKVLHKSTMGTDLKIDVNAFKNKLIFLQIENDSQIYSHKLFVH